MFRQLVTLVRGHGNDAAEAYADANAIVILRQQIRDCAQAVVSARKAVAVATAQNEQESSQHARLSARIADLEGRAVLALEQERHDLAREAAQSIAMMEDERASSLEAQRRFSGEIERLKRILQTAEARLRDLQRGLRLAQATNATQRLRTDAGSAALTTLRDAEETLSRLRARQEQIDLAADALAALEHTGDPLAVSEKLAAAGCGAPAATSAEAVLERLRLKIRAAA